jgi:hypothetical protein
MDLGVKQEAADQGQRQSSAIFFVLLLIFVALMGYGLYLGNVFETYHNGSNL